MFIVLYFFNFSKICGIKLVLIKMVLSFTKTSSSLISHSSCMFIFAAGVSSQALHTCWVHLWLESAARTQRETPSLVTCQGCNRYPGSKRVQLSFPFPCPSRADFYQPGCEVWNPQKFLATKNWVLGSDWFSLLKGERRSLVINQAFQNLIKEPKKTGSLGEAIVLKTEVGPNKKVGLEASERVRQRFCL